MKVGILSCYNHKNYGSVLQSYATQRIVDKLGYDAVTIAYTKPINYMTQSKVKYYYHKITNMDILKGKIRLVLSRQNEKRYKDIVNGRRLRNQYFNRFVQKNFILTEMMENRKKLSDYSLSCDTILVGSDQLWNPINVEHDFYTLTFVPNEINKVSYATSIGTDNIPKYQMKTYKTFLDRIDSISVRETSGADIISGLGINKEVQVVLDPTLLFDRDEWMDIQTEKPLYNEKYIFCYFLGVNKDHRDFANGIKKLTGYKIIALQHLDEFVKEDMLFGDIKPYDIGPAEFINLVRNAEYVCTDSFHGTCFSIINHKDFFAFNRYVCSNTQSTNTRIDSLLTLTGLEDRRIVQSLDLSTIKSKMRKKINYADVDKKIQHERNKSLEFLKKALKGKS